MRDEEEIRLLVFDKQTEKIVFMETVKQKTEKYRQLIQEYLTDFDILTSQVVKIINLAGSPKTSELFCQSVFHVNLSFIEAV